MTTAFSYDCTPSFVHSAYRCTGKERDSESGNDYFGARYYASTMGRFLSPDWSAKEEPVPYAKLDNPQTLNLYQYMENNPLGGVDPDGHDGPIILTPEGPIMLPFPVAGPSLTQQQYNEMGNQLGGFLETQAGYLKDIIVGDITHPIQSLSTIFSSSATPTPPYDTGTANDLKGNSQVGDNLDVHHVPQSQPAGQIVQGYDKGTAPAIALPKGEHQAIPTDKGTATRTPRDQLAKDVRDLRNNTNAPNSQIQKVIEQNKDQYPEMNKPQE